MKVIRNTAVVIFLIGLLSVLAIGLAYNIQLQPVSKSTKKIEVTIKSGMKTSAIIHLLKEKKLIKDEFMAKIHAKIFNLNSFKAGNYSFSPNLGTQRILSDINKGKFSSYSDISITFQEGINIPRMAKKIAENTSNTEADVYNILKDGAYIDSLIKKYWFLTDDIKKPDIYYPLEGYLFPDTYKFKDKNVTIKEIFEKMLDKADSVLKEYESDIESLDFTMHEFITFASLVESEGISKKDRDKISAVFHNRLEQAMPLGSCVTTYYAAKVDMGERDLYLNEINEANPYNTRGPHMEGKLPVGPISNPGQESMEATLKPNINSYLYFVADKNYETYFSKTYEEHNAKIRELKDEGMWKEW